MKTSILLIALVAACGGGSDDPPVIDAPAQPDAPNIDASMPREVHMSTQPMQAGEVLEAMMIGGTADRAIIFLTAPVMELDWNIHAHPNGTTITVHEELNQMTVTYDFIPTETTDWFLLLRNGGGTNMDVQVKVELYGAMTFGFI